MPLYHRTVAGIPQFENPDLEALLILYIVNE
jgi:hypothetical protein